MRFFYYSGATLPSEAAKSVHVMKMCQALGKAGHDVHLFAKGDTSIAEEEIFKSYGVQQIFQLALAKNVKIPLLSGAARLLDLPEQARKIGKPDIVYGRDPMALALFTPPDAKVSFEAHQMPYLAVHKWALKRLMAHPKFCGIVTISDALRQDMLLAYPGLKPEQVCVAHDGADLPEKAKSVELKGREGMPAVGYTGSLHAGKGMELIVKLAMKAPDFDFHIVGGSKDQITALKKKKLPDNIVFYGHVPHGELGGYLAAFDILLAPYQDKATIKTGQDISRWISPMKLFEYMGARKPIICSDMPVIREILTDNKTAFLVEPANVEGWSYALKEARDEVEKVKTMTDRAYKLLEEKFTWDKRTEAILKFITK